MNDTLTPVSWSSGRHRRGVDVFIEFPTSDADNEAAGLVLHPQVGKWMALGGDAYHLPEAWRRLHELALMTDTEDGARGIADTGVGTPRLLEGFNGLLPNREKLAAAFPGLVDVPGHGGAVGKGERTARKRARRLR